MSDAVNKPAHYNQGQIECIEAMQQILTPEEYRGYLKGNVFKYLWREKDKNGNEDIRKGKSYYDLLIELVDKSEAEQLATGEVAGEVTGEATGEATGEVTGEVKPPDGWRPNDTVSLAMQMAANSFGRKDGVFNGAGFANAMQQLAGVTCNLLDGYVVATILDGRTDVEVLKGGSHYKYLFWSPGNTQSIEQPAEAPEGTGEVKPPDGWRFLEVGEVIRKGDLPWADGWVYATESIMLGMTLQAHWKPMIRRNKFKVGEKVVHVPSKDVLEVVEVVEVAGEVKVADIRGTVSRYYPEVLAPYIEEPK